MGYTLEQVRAEVDKLIEKFGEDFVYIPADGPDIGGCYYRQLKVGERVAQRSLGSSYIIPEGDVRTQTACLAGSVLDALGETRHRQHESTTLMFIHLDCLPGMLEGDAASFLDGCQATQDRGGTWGEAREEGLKRVQLYVEQQARLAAIRNGSY